MRRRLYALKNSVRWLLGDQRRFITEKSAQGVGASETMLMPDHRLAGRLRRAVYVPREVFISSDADFVAKVLTEHKHDFTGGDAYRFLAPYLGKRSIFVTDGPAHAQAKRSVVHTIRRCVTFDDARVAAVRADVDELLRDGQYQMLPVVQQISARIVFDALFPGEAPRARNRVIDAAIDNVFRVTGGILLFPSIFPKRFRRMARIRDNRATVLAYVHRNLGAFIHRNRVRIGVGTLKRNTAIDNLVTMFIAGFETTSASIAWGLVALAGKQANQQMLRDEIAPHLDDDAQLLAYVNAPDTLLHRFSTEVLRRYPTLPFIVRRVERDTTLTTDRASVALKRGNYVLLSIEDYNRQLVTAGDLFDPFGRDDAPDPKKLLTFGGGDKMCPGRQMATTEIKLITALILGRAMVRPNAETRTNVRRNRVSAVPDRGANLAVSMIG
jgi:cytochrome P450